MRSELFFKDIRRSDYTENFINDKIEFLLERLTQPENDLHVTVRVGRGRQRTTNRHGTYQCEVVVKSGMSDKIYKAMREDRNLFRSIVAAFDTMKVILSKSHKRLHHDRRRRKTPEFTNYTPPSVASSTP